MRFWCSRLRVVLVIALLCAGSAQAVRARVQAPGAPPDASADKEDASASSPAAEAAKLFANWDKPESPGCAVAVVRDGKIVYKHGFGTANLEYAVPITPSTIFHVASVSKQFTAFAIYLLAHDHKLSLDDDVRKYLPELHDFGKTITVRHLLHHTSGLRDQWNLLRLAGWRLQDVITERDVLDLVWRQEELNFEPGAEHLYSNTGYTLLGLIVKRVSGKSLDAFCQERVFKPLGMKHTHFHDDNQKIVPGRSYSYAPKRGGGFANSPLQYATVGASSLFTTVEDLALWDQNFYDKKVGGPDVLAGMLEKGKLNDGKRIDYASGLLVGKYRGLKTVKHNGGDAGYRSTLVRFPEQRFSVIILANLSSFDPERMAGKVADIYLREKLSPVPSGSAKPTTVRKEIKVDPKLYDAYVGDYQGPRGQVLTISTENGRLMASDGGSPKIELLPFTESDFFNKVLNGELSFVKEKDGTVSRLVLHRDGRDDETARRVHRTPGPAAARLSEYVGDYYSRELGVIYKVVARDGKLWLRHPRGEASTRETQTDAYSVDFPIGTMNFTRDASKNVNGLLISTNGPVRNLRFVRTELKAAR